MIIYYVDYLYAIDAPRQPLGYFATRKLAERKIAETADEIKYPYGFHGSDCRIREIIVEEE